MPSLMAFFKRKEKAPPDSERLDWKLFERGAIALYHKGAVLSQDIAWFRQNGYVIHELDGARWSSAAEFHDDVQKLLNFPGYYGRNLASWVDCISELAVPDEGGMALVFRLYDAFTRAQPALAQTILDSIESTSRRFLLTGRRLAALVQSDDPRIRFERVGALPVTWNPREWTDVDRGMSREGA